MSLNEDLTVEISEVLDSFFIELTPLNIVVGCSLIIDLLIQV